MAELAEAAKRRRAVEMLAERHADAVRAHDLKVDQANLDDIAVTSKARNAARGLEDGRNLA
jgi:flagellar biosynthesis chaperone FliJ